MCCVEGESGAPLEAEELSILVNEYHSIQSYLTEKGKQAIAEQGVFITEVGKSEYSVYHTPLMEGGACAYATFDQNGIVKCGIEEAWQNGKTSFRKPVSCHLYPIRVKRHEQEGITYVNYMEWELCSPACDLGKKLSLPVYKFLKEPLIKKFGEEFYEALSATAQYLADTEMADGEENE